MSPVRSRNEVLEVRNVDGLLHIARKIKRPDEWNPPYESMTPMVRASFRAFICCGSPRTAPSLSNSLRQLLCELRLLTPFVPMPPKHGKDSQDPGRYQQEKQRGVFDPGKGRNAERHDQTKQADLPGRQVHAGRERPER
jgi:hypothetical protein